jgi:hypothetical protein
MTNSAEKTVLILVNKETTVIQFRLEVVEALVSAGYRVIVSTPKGQRYGEIEAVGARVVDAPLEKGTVIGKATVSCGGKVYGTVELKTESSVELDYFALYSAKMMKFFSNPWLWLVLGGLLVIVAGYILLVYRINHPKKKKAPASRTGGRIRVSPAKDDD